MEIKLSNSNHSTLLAGLKHRHHISFIKGCDRLSIPSYNSTFLASSKPLRRCDRKCTVAEMRFLGGFVVSSTFGDECGNIQRDLTDKGHI